MQETSTFRTFNASRIFKPYRLCRVSNCRMTVYDDLERVWSKVVVVYLKLQTQHSVVFGLIGYISTSRGI
jgi:hypothetical protein